MTVPPAPGHAGRVRIEVELVGGHGDGTRLVVQDPLPFTLMYPVPVDLSRIFTEDPTDHEPFMPVVDHYDLAGIRDDGTRYYLHSRITARRRG